MKKLIKNILIFFTIGGIIINLIIYYFMWKYPENFITNNEDYMLLTSMYDFKHTNKLKTNVIIGDSRGNASLIPDMISSNFINLSLPGSNFLEGYLTVKSRQKISKIDTLILIYGFNHYESNLWTDKRSIPLNFISKNELSNLETLERQYGQIISKKESLSSINLLYLQLGRRLKYNHFPLMYSMDFINSFNTLDNKNSFDYHSFVSMSNGHFLFGNKDSFNQVSFINSESNFTPNKVNLVYLDSIMQLASRNRIKVIIVLPPINYSTFNVYKNSNYFKSINQYFSSNLKCYMINKINYLPNNCFSDSVHVNKHGSQVFTRKVTEILYPQK